MRRGRTSVLVLSFVGVRCHFFLNLLGGTLEKIDIYITGENII